MTIPMENFTVCYFGTYRDEYSRNIIMLKSLYKKGINVIVCHEKVWEDIEDRVEAVKKGWFNPKLWYRFIKAYFLLTKKFFSIVDFDILIVGYPGQFDVYLARVLAWIKRKPLAWDVFMSIYLISIERKLDNKNKFSVEILKIIERNSLKLPDLLVFDTNEYLDWFKEIYGLKRLNYCIVPTGADEDIYFSFEDTNKLELNQFKIIYYGTFIPNHGVPYVIEASKYLTSEKNIVIQLIGEGPELEKCKKLVETYKLSFIEFIPWQKPNQLREYIEDAEIVLGAFGKTPQSLMTVQNKIFEGLSMGKLVISGDSPTVRNHLINNREIVLCDRESPSSLAEKILELKNSKNQRIKIAKNGHQRFIDNYSTNKIGDAFVRGLQGTLK